MNEHTQQPQFIAHYRVARLLGSGGMGEVFLAEDTKLDRSVALKLLPKEVAADASRRKRFLAEAKAASALNHPSVCTIYEVGETNEGQPFIAMEYLEGQALHALARRRRLELREIAEIGFQVAEALEAARQSQVVHRDIKPGNIIVQELKTESAKQKPDSQLRVKVLDFGLAKRLDQAGAASVMTQEGAVLGTPNYLSPELALGREVDSRSDIFSLGVVLYELAAGRNPFAGASFGETVNNILNKNPDPLKPWNPTVTPEFERVAAKCLEKDPTKRYATPRQLRDDLAKLQANLQTPRSSNRMVLALAVIVVALGVIGLGALRLIRSKPVAKLPATPMNQAAAAPQKSVAVLPFDNFSGEPDTDYLSDGLTEEITTALSRIPGLKVVSRNSAFVFKGRREDMRKIGAALRVNTLLEGSMRKDGRQLRVTAQLINVADGFHLWSETYNRTVDDVLAVQEEIAARIAERLQGNQGGNVASRPAVSPDAHRLYLQARLFWNKRSEAGLNRAIQLFQETITREPAYAAAHSGLAAGYLVLPMYSPHARTSVYGPLARTAARRAIELDPTCAEAHAVLGNLAEADWDLKSAGEHLRRAIQLDPNNATAHHWYGRYLNLHGRRSDGWRELQTALDLDPLSPVINSAIPEWHYMGGNYPRAITEARDVIERYPDFQVLRRVLIAALLLNGQYAEALDEIEQARKLHRDEPSALLGFRLYALTRSGKEEETRQLLAQLEQSHQEGKPVIGELMVAYAGLRAFDRVFDLLEPLTIEEGLNSSMLCDPFQAELRSQPRFQELLRKLGLPK